MSNARSSGSTAASHDEPDYYRVMKHILVTGATGQVGSAVIAALCGVEGINVRAAVRDVARATRIWNGEPNVHPVEFDFFIAIVKTLHWPTVTVSYCCARRSSTATSAT